VMSLQRVKTTYANPMNKTRVMKAAFDPKRHLTNCLDLPARNPEPYYRPDRKRVPPYISDICVLRDHADEVEELKANGVPHYLARVMVLMDYADTWEGLAKRVKEATRQ
jgi:hypothetical protein